MIRTRFPHRFTMNRRRFLGFSAAMMSASIMGTANAASSHLLKIGIMAGEDEDLWALVAQNAVKVGLTLRVIPFSDYNQPNEALSEHDLDANAFQHKPFLDAQIKAHGYHISPVGNTFFQPIGLFSRKWSSIQAIPHGASIGLPNDPSNEGRALHLLETLGLLKVSPDAGLFPTVLDVTDNPHTIAFQELDAGIVGRSLPDLDAAVVNSDWAIKAGINIEKERIGTESLENNPYVNFIAVNDSDLHAPWVQPLVRAFQQPNIREAIQKIYRGTVTPAWS